MRLILARHGNTFAPGDTVVQVGKYQDLPLAESGKQQALKLAEELQTRNIIPQLIFAAPLKRTRQFAELVGKFFSVNSVSLDQRLSELDYGQWAGLTQNEIIERFGGDELTAWNNKGIWPTKAGWETSESEVIEQVFSFASDLLLQPNNQQVVLVVSSNGRLRYFLNLIPGLRQKMTDQGQLKISTGAYGLLEYCNQQWSFVDWNCIP